MLLGLVFSNLWGNFNRSVLGYATDINATGLLANTNQQRGANGVGVLTLNGALSQAAQNKAADMAANDYWSHNSPSGATPWSFIAASGYSYVTAGENLAYGFTTSSETITGWMNSPSHRANILNASYKEVGFGIVNTPNFQGSGAQTIVVAMYAQPITPVAAPTATPPMASAPTPPIMSTQMTTPKPTTAAASKTDDNRLTPAPAQTPAEPAQQPTPSKDSPNEHEPAPQRPLASYGAKEQATDDSKPVTRLQSLSADNASWVQLAVSLTAVAALMVFLLRHGFAWHKMLVRSEKFILKHPFLDMALVACAVAGFVLTRTSGIIQ